MPVIPKQLTTKRLVLSLLTPADSRRVLEFQVENREFLAPTEPLRSQQYYTLHCQASMLREEYQLALEHRTLIRYWVTRKHSNEIIGSVLLANITYGQESSCFLGYRLAKLHQHQGYMTEAAEAVLSFAFDALGIKTIEANIMPRNKASLTVAHRLGFLVTGVTPGYLQINGILEDHVRTKLTRKQWKNLQQQ